MAITLESTRVVSGFNPMDRLSELSEDFSVFFQEDSPGTAYGQLENGPN